jgi:hypothetical protein
MVEKRKALAAVFLSIAIISTVSLISPTVNYIEFYKSIERFVLEVDRITLNLTNLVDGKFTIYVMFNASNYSGFNQLKLTAITCHLDYFEDSAITLVAETKVFSPPILLGPYNTSSVPVTFEIDYLKTSNPSPILNFISLLQTNPERITWIPWGQYTLYAFTYSFTTQFWFSHETILRS